MSKFLDIEGLRKVWNKLKSYFVTVDGNQNITGTKIFTQPIGLMGGLNLNNSDITGANSIYFSGLSNNSKEGISFLNDTQNKADTIWSQNGKLYYTPQRNTGEFGTSYEILHKGNNILEGVLENQYYVNNFTGWLRIAKVMTNSSSTLLEIHRSYFRKPSETYLFAISVCYNYQITQLSGIYESKLIDKIRIHRLNDDCAYIDIHLNNVQEEYIRWFLIGVGNTEALANPEVGTDVFEFEPAIGFKTFQNF